MKLQKFEGFCPETVDFLWGIRMNNNREWFTEHKPEYLQYLYEPMKALAAELYKPFEGIPGLVCKVSRIYRDMRMPQPEGPYKDHLWISLRQNDPWWAEHPCLFLEIRPEAVSYGFVHWKPSTEIMQRFRRDTEQNPSRFCDIVRGCEKAAGVLLEGEDYKRLRVTADPDSARMINKKHFLLIRSVEPGEEMFSPKLAKTAAEMLHEMKPLYDYFRFLESLSE